MKIKNESVLQLKKVCNVRLQIAASFSSVTFCTFSLSLNFFFFFFFFAFSLCNIESQINTFFKGHHICKDIWTPEIGESLHVQIEPNNH